MPIRFKCYYCKQLMSISRRKAGTVVPCPKCAAEIIVPPLEGSPAIQEEKPAPGAAFDDPNFNPFGVASPGVGKPEDTQAGEAATPPPAPAIPGTLPSPAETHRRVGVFVPLGLLIVSVGVVVLLLIFVFVLGLIIGIRNRVAPNVKEAAATYPAPCSLFSGSVKNPQRSA